VTRPTKNLWSIAGKLYTDARHRAGKKDIPFDLTRDWIYHRLMAGRCELTGIRFECGERSEGERAGMYAPSVDRRVAALGYVADNCRLVIWHYNLAKGAYDDDAVLELAQAIISKRG